MATAAVQLDTSVTEEKILAAVERIVEVANPVRIVAGAWGLSAGERFGSGRDRGPSGASGKAAGYAKHARRPWHVDGFAGLRCGASRTYAAHAGKRER